jgi:tetratricopeptide (TPR) repeat protein
MIELLLQAENALSLGLLDRAETLYRQVAAADPRNAIAVVGLARVSLERRREVEALELARRALTIDPENSAARRMVQRLEEVLRHLGVEFPAAMANPAPGPPAGGSPELPGNPAPDPEPTPADENPTSTEAARRRSFVDRLLGRE